MGQMEPPLPQITSRPIERTVPWWLQAEFRRTWALHEAGNQSVCWRWWGSYTGESLAINFCTSVPSFIANWGSAVQETHKLPLSESSVESEFFLKNLTLGSVWAWKSVWVLLGSVHWMTRRDSTVTPEAQIRLDEGREWHRLWGKSVRKVLACQALE